MTNKDQKLYLELTYQYVNKLQITVYSNICTYNHNININNYRKHVDLNLFIQSESR